MNISGPDMNFILEKKRGHHYQVACGKFFEAKHKGTALIETELGGITHPNQFFDESMKFYGDVGGDKPVAAGASSSGAAASSSAEPAAVDVPMPEAVPVA